MNGKTESVEKNFVRTPQWFFRQFLPNTRSLTQVKIVAEVINQTRGYHKPEDESTLTHLAKSVRMSRSTVSAHIQVLLDTGVIQLENTRGMVLSNPAIRKSSGIRRLRSVFVVPASLVLTEDKLLLLRTPRKNFPLVLKRDNKLTDDTTSECLNMRHNKRDHSKESVTKEREPDASHLHSPRLMQSSKSKEKIKRHYTTYEEALTRKICSKCGCLMYSTTQYNRTLRKYGKVFCRRCDKKLHHV
ncbi:hypothetical protein C4565_01395 [Candidatus Parcubacteria bacterium]|nr:MAG: hypothetical protein C4565_01395 [Candidatus Parcubacteria bacterium]